MIRKQLFGVDELTALPQSAYAPEVSERVYSLLRERAETVIAAGWPVIVDAVHTQAEGRDRLARIAEAHDARFTGLWLEAPDIVLADRVTRRTGDASDATPDVVRLQSREDVGEIAWHRVATARKDDVVAEEVFDLVISKYQA